MHSIEYKPIITQHEESSSQHVENRTDAPQDKSELKGVKIALDISQIQSRLSDICVQVDRGDLDPGHGHLACMELLSKQLAYKRENLLEKARGKSEFHVIVPHESGQGFKRVIYLVDEMVRFGNNLAGGHLMALSMKPADAHEQACPIVLYHGTKINPITDDNSTDTFLANFDPRGIGRSALNFFGTRLERGLDHFFDQVTQNGARKAIVLGHSLGGTLAELSAVYKSEAVDRAYLFNAPGSHFYAYQKAQVDQQRAISEQQRYPKIYRFETKPGTDSIIGLGSRKIGRVIHVARENETTDMGAHTGYMFVDNFAGFEGDESQIPKNFELSLESACERGMQRSKEFNEQREYYLGIPKHRGLLAQTVASVLGYPILLTVVGLSRALFWTNRMLNNTRMLDDYKKYKRQF